MADNAYQEALEKIEEAQQKNFRVLYLDGMNLRELPPEIGKLADLTDLWLSDNELTHLPPEIGDLTNLKELDLYNNELAEFPTEITHLKQLTYLSLARNKLTSLPNATFIEWDYASDLTLSSPGISPSSQYGKWPKKEELI